MYLASILAVSAVIISVAASPYKIPTSDGFPNPNLTQLAVIEEIAAGTLPDGPLPTSLKDAGITTLQLIALNELFEVAYFLGLLYNVINKASGYGPKDIAPLDEAYVINSLVTIVEQEKLHAAGANAILKSAKQDPIAPCEYIFPKQNFMQAIALAQTFTDVVLGTLPEAQAAFAKDAADESPVVPLLGSVIGQEGEQNGFYRFVQKKTPSAAPFLTGGSPSFAFTAIQQFIVPDSCPKPLNTYNLTTFGKLDVVTKPQPKNMALEFRVAGHVDNETNSIVYLSGQNKPVTVGISGLLYSGNLTQFVAPLPWEDGFADGLTIAALVNGTGSFASNDAVAAATVFGPGLIEVN